MVSSSTSKLWKSISNLAYFGSGVIAATAVSVYARSQYETKDVVHPSIETESLGESSEVIPSNFENILRQTRLNNAQQDKCTQEFQDRLTASIRKAKKLCERVKVKHALPGLSVAVSVNGTTHWTQGFGYSDVENEVTMKPESVVRIGSISKPMTMAMLGKLMEENKIDLDLPVQTYVPSFPQKQVDGKDVVITTRHLLSHLSGIRHYMTKEMLEAIPSPDEMELEEYFLKKRYESVDKALEIFQNDELLHEPGNKFTYTTHGWTLVSAVLEKITGVSFERHTKRMFKHWGLQNTFLDESQPIVYHRVRNYSWDKKNQEIENSQFVDNSYKWAGGGFLSNTGDLVQFAHIMLSSFQNPTIRSGNPGSEDILAMSKPYLKSETVAEMWTSDPRTARPGRDVLYGLGFFVGEPMQKCFFCATRDLMMVTHSGAAIGGSSVLMMTFPKNFRSGTDETDEREQCHEFAKTNGKVKGVVVALLTNLTSVGLTETAQEITKLFEWLI